LEGITSWHTRKVIYAGPVLVAGISCRIGLMIALLMSLQGATAQKTQANSTGNCHVGTYRLSDGRDVDVAPDDEYLQWRMKDGTTGELTPTTDGSWFSTLGMTRRPDGKRVSFGDCTTGKIRFDGVEGHRIAFDVFETSLGTGASSGKFTHDYLTLSDDAVAAMREAKRLAGVRAQRIGYLGTSQGGWVAPLAAKIEAVDFVMVAYGLAISPLDEDRSCLALDLTRRGYGADALAKAMEIADATSVVLLSDFREGYDQVEAVRQKYEKEPWFPLLHGNVSFLILQHPSAELKELGPTLFPGAPLQYDPMPVLRNLRTPQLWLLGEDDIDAPSSETAARLRVLAASGSPITTTMFRGAEHGMYEYEVAPDGTRRSTRQPEGYFRMMVDFVRDGRLHGSYGDLVSNTERGAM
jgi:dienelactone hydrolase